MCIYMCVCERDATLYSTAHISTRAMLSCIAHALFVCVHASLFFVLSLSLCVCVCLMFSFIHSGERNSTNVRRNGSHDTAGREETGQSSVCVCVLVSLIRIYQQRDDEGRREISLKRQDLLLIRKHLDEVASYGRANERADGTGGASSSSSSVASDMSQLLSS